jgi:hypothetical protein
MRLRRTLLPIAAGLIAGMPAGLATPAGGVEPSAITSANSATATAGTPFTFTVTTSSAGGTPVITSTLWPLGLHMVNNGDGTATVTGTPAATVFGLHAVILSEKVNGLTVAKQNFHLTIYNTGHFVTMPVDNVRTGVPFTYPILTRYAFPVPAISTTSTLPDGVTFTDNGNGIGHLTGTPAIDSDGLYHIVFSSNNGIGTPATFTLILGVRQPPAITSADNDTIVAGTPMTPFPVTVTGYPVPVIRAAGLPIGLHLVAGRITGTVAPAGAGTYHVNIAALNAVGVATQSFTLVVTH